MPTNTDELRALDRQVAETVMGWRAEIVTTEWQAPRWALVDEKHYLVFETKDFVLTAEDAWETCPPFSADTPEGWGVMRMVWKRLEELGYTIYPSGPHTPESGPFRGQIIYQVQIHLQTPGQKRKWRTVDALSVPAAVAEAAVLLLEATDAVS